MKKVALIFVIVLAFATFVIAQNFAPPLTCWALT